MLVVLIMFPFCLCHDHLLNSVGNPRVRGPLVSPGGVGGGSSWLVFIYVFQSLVLIGASLSIFCSFYLAEFGRLLLMPLMGFNFD